MKGLLIGMALLLGACDYSSFDTPIVDKGAQRNASRVAAEAEPLLPAWDEGPTAPGKADEFDDFRAAHPELYGVTAPPSQTVRPLAEYEPTQAVLIRPGPDVGKFHASVIRELAGHVDQIWVLHATDQSAKMREILVGVGVPEESLRFFDMTKTDANWVRDFGPIAVLTAEKQIGFVDFRYYHQRAHDDAVPTRLAQELGIRVFRPSLSFEGGNVMADTRGTCYMTGKVYTQNAGHSAQEVDTWLDEYLGCHRLVIVERPAHLSTGHIDMFAKLVGPQTVLVGDYGDKTTDSNGAVLDTIAVQLGSETGESGEPLEVLRIPMPPYQNEVWYTYTNSLLVNDVLLMPTFKEFATSDQGTSLEEQARSVYQQALPETEVVSIPSDSLIGAGGAVHCMTMSLPEGTLASFQPAPALLCGLNEVSKCAEAGQVCLGWPAEGECVGNVLHYCGADGYPRQPPCSHCCGPMATDQPFHTCLAPSECGSGAAQCLAGQSGCSWLATHRWSCEAGPTGELQKRYRRCESGPCIDGACMTDASQACAALESGCLANWALTCAEGAEGLEPNVTLCAGEDEVCQAGESGAGCVAGSTGAGSKCPWSGYRRCAPGDESVEMCTVDSATGKQSWSNVEPCGPGRTCEDGLCIDIPPEPDVVEGEVIEEGEVVEARGGGCAAGGQGSAGLWLVLMLLAAGWKFARGRPGQ